MFGHVAASAGRPHRRRARHPAPQRTCPARSQMAAKPQDPQYAADNLAAPTEKTNAEIHRTGPAWFRRSVCLAGKEAGTR
ncbi:hypothetical protein Acsp04_66270 [Actinomadura sp. NBRC 104425]|nr:hypothetical protein Acsp04_66270 [Actinomadura sp. NBRC 104425]